MKRIMKIILCLLILLFLKGDSCAIYGQKIIEDNGDTLILITPANVQTMNSIIIERQYLIEEILLMSELNEVKDSLIKDQGEIIKIGQNILKEEKDKHSLEIQEQAISLKASYKRDLEKWVSISGIIGLILGILLGK